ncbi:MAG: hypothetical protein RLZZ574_2584, partial [Cyanobacteriota bacterium]
MEQAKKLELRTHKIGASKRDTLAASLNQNDF